MAHSTNENYRPSRKYGFGGGLAVGSLLGAYIGYKIGRARGTKKGGTFDTEKKIYRNVKSKFAYGGGVDYEKVRKADEVYREHNIERKQKGYKEFSNESATLWDKGGYDERLKKLNLTYDERLKLNPKNWYAGGGGVGKEEKVIFNLDTYELRYKGVKNIADSWVERTETTMTRLGYSFDGHNFKTIKAMKEYYKKYVDKMSDGSSYANGGGIGFKGLANKVAKRYEGKSVAPKYQGEYGKRYSKSEAQEVGRKVAGKVYQQQQSKKFDGGGNIDDLIYG
jgi:hypothetical protein